MGHHTPQSPASHRHHVPEGEVRAAAKAKKTRLVGWGLLVGGLAVGALSFMDSPFRAILIVAAGGMVIFGPLMIATNTRK